MSAYIDLIRNGAARLASAQEALMLLDPGTDQGLADLKGRAMAALEAGRLREALALQDAYTELYRRNIEEVNVAPRRALAASHAAAARTAETLGDYVGAAARFEEAARLAPENDARWSYLMAQAGNLYAAAGARDANMLYRAIRLLQEEALPLVAEDINSTRRYETLEAISIMCDVIGPYSC
jgi:hypothetical protein